MLILLNCCYFYVNFEMKTIQLWSGIHPQNYVMLYIKRGPDLCSLSMSTILLELLLYQCLPPSGLLLFIFCLLCCTVVVLSSTLLLLQSSLLLHQNQNIREEKERYYAITNHIFASVCDRNILSMSNLMDIFSCTS